jgi:predicted DNA-binding ribbon-helix-helix protein
MTSLETYSVKLGERWTTLRVEPEFMWALREIARTLGIGVNDLCTEIACGSGEGSLISAVRVFVVNHYRRRLGTLEGVAGGYSTITRRPIPLGAADAPAELVSLYRWWREHCAPGGGVPAHGAIDPGLFRRLGLGGMVHVVDVTADDPANYRFRVFGKRVALAWGGDFAGGRLGDLQGPQYRSATVEDYLTVAATETPQLQEVDAWLGGNHRIYQRLIVPLATSHGKRDCLLVAVRYRPGFAATVDQPRRAERRTA